MLTINPSRFVDPVGSQRIASGLYPMAYHKANQRSVFHTTHKRETGFDASVSLYIERETNAIGGYLMPELIKPLLAVRLYSSRKARDIGKQGVIDEIPQGAR